MTSDPSQTAPVPAAKASPSSRPLFPVAALCFLSGICALLAFLATGVYRGRIMGAIRAHGITSCAAFEAPSFSSEREAPINRGALPCGIAMDLNLRFRFQARSAPLASTEVFQTGPAGAGLRMEIEGETVALVFQDRERRGARRTLCQDCRPGAWHQVEIEALNDGYLNVRFDGRPVEGAGQRPPFFETTSVKVGGGSEAERRFDGEISDFRMIVRHVPQRPANAVYYLLHLLLPLVGFTYAGVLGLRILRRRSSRTIPLARDGGVAAPGSWRTIYGYWVLISGLFGGALLTVSVRTEILQRAYPFNTFLLLRYERYGDLFLFQRRFDYFGQAAFWATSGFLHADYQFNYPPLAGLLLLGFYRFPAPLALFVGIVALAALAGAAAFAAALRRRGIATGWAALFSFTAVATSFPLIFAVDRANIEVFAVIATGVGLLALMRGRWWWAATLFAIATALKMFPVILFALLLSRKSWRQLTYGLALTLLLTGVGLQFIGPTLAVATHAFLHGIRFRHGANLFLDRPYEVGFQHSLFSIVRQGMLFFHTTDPAFEEYRLAYSIYSPIVALGGLILFFGRIMRLPRLNQVLAIAVCSILLPGWSGDYTLLHLYVPWALLILWILDHPREYGRRMWWYLAPFAVAFTPQPYFYFRSLGFDRDFSGQVKAVALLVLLIVAVAMPLKGDAEAA